MSTSKSDEILVCDGDVKHFKSISKQLLASVSEIIESIPSANPEHNNILAVASYFYRTSSAIRGLQSSENSLANETEILQSLSQSSDMAKGILGKLQQNGQTIMDDEVKNMIKQLEDIINQMGYDLSLIPPSAFKDEEYADITISSLSEEMRNFRFEISPVQKTKPNQQKTNQLYLEDHPDVESMTIESDLYSTSMVVCSENSHVSDIPQIMEAIRSASESSNRHVGNMSNRLSRSMTEVDTHMEPMYKSFICPLTNQVMDDPVTISSGLTYERRAITEYFKKFGNSEEVNCPITREKLQSRAMSPNLALRSILHEWKDRNDSARLKVIRAALSIGSTESMILEALKDLQNLCQRNPKKIKEVYSIGIIPLLVRLLELRDKTVRCLTLGMIRLLVEQGEAKEQIAKTPVISATIRMLSSSYQPIRHAALLLLIEFSKSNFLSEKIGHVTGGILILLQTKYNRSIDTFASEAADQILNNMERCPSNIKFMAEIGYLEPLLSNLIEGSEERKLEMMTYLGEIVLEDDSKTYVAERTTPDTILHFENPWLFTSKNLVTRNLVIFIYI